MFESLEDFLYAHGWRETEEYKDERIIEDVFVVFKKDDNVDIILSCEEIIICVDYGHEYLVRGMHEIEKLAGYLILNGIIDYINDNVDYQY